MLLSLFLIFRIIIRESPDPKESKESHSVIEEKLSKKLYFEWVRPLVTINSLVRNYKPAAVKLYRVIFNFFAFKIGKAVC